MTNAQALKVYISADIEGICGITSEHQVGPLPHEPQTQYEWAVRQMSRELSVLAEVAERSWRFKHLLINDAHARMTNIWPTNWPGGSQLASGFSKLHVLTGKPKPLAMMAGLDASFSFACCIGYHAKAGSQKGVLVHSFNETIADIELNGRSVGELGFNVVYAWQAHGVPVLLVSGDDILEQEARALLPDCVRFVRTKEALGFGAALNRPETAVYAEHQEALSAVAEDYQMLRTVYQLPRQMEPPYTLRVRFSSPLYTDIVSVMPVLARLDGTTVELRTDTIQQAYAWMQTLYCLTAYAKTI